MTLLITLRVKPDCPVSVFVPPGKVSLRGSDEENRKSLSTLWTSLSNFYRRDADLSACTDPTSVLTTTLYTVYAYFQ